MEFDLVTIPQATERLGIPPLRLRRLADAGGIPAQLAGDWRVIWERGLVWVGVVASQTTRGKDQRVIEGVR